MIGPNLTAGDDATWLGKWIALAPVLKELHTDQLPPTSRIPQPDPLGLAPVFAVGQRSVEVRALLLKVAREAKEGVEAYVMEHGLLKRRARPDLETLWCWGRALADKESFETISLTAAGSGSSSTHRILEEPWVTKATAKGVEAHEKAAKYRMWAVPKYDEASVANYEDIRKRVSQAHWYGIQQLVERLEQALGFRLLTEEQVREYKADEGSFLARFASRQTDRLQSEVQKVDRRVDALVDALALIVTSIYPWEVYNLQKLASGHFGPYVLEAGLEGNLLSLRSRGFISVDSVTAIPKRSGDLSDFVIVTDLGRQFLHVRNTLGLPDPNPWEGHEVRGDVLADDPTRPAEGRS